MLTPGQRMWRRETKRTREERERIGVAECERRAADMRQRLIGSPAAKAEFIAARKVPAARGCSVCGGRFDSAAGRCENATVEWPHGYEG